RWNPNLEPWNLRTAERGTRTLEPWNLGTVEPSAYSVHSMPISRWRADPATVRPMLASLEEPPLAQAGLVYEPKYDGIRALVDVRPAETKGSGVTVAIYSRN